MVNGKTANAKLRNQKYNARIFNKFPQPGATVELSVT
jgi:hypothetical protein